MESYDLELILDKEGTEGLLKIYNSMQKDILIKPLVQLGFLEKDFTHDYFNTQINEALKYLDLASLFQQESLEYNESAKDRFKRKEEITNNLKRCDNSLSEIREYKTQEYVKSKAKLHLQTFDHYFDVLIFKYSLDLACKKGKGKMVQNPNLTKIIEKYSSVLKTYVENKKFIKKNDIDMIKILNKHLTTVTSSYLEELLSNYEITDEKSLRHFEDLRDKILETKDNLSFISMFDEGKKYGWYYVKNGLFIIGFLTAVLGGIAAYILLLAGCIKAGASNYLAGGILGLSTYLMHRYRKGSIIAGDAITSNFQQRLLHKNSQIKNMIIDKNKIFGEINS